MNNPLDQATPKASIASFFSGELSENVSEPS
jgi:hypothetical protein